MADMNPIIDLDKPNESIYKAQTVSIAARPKEINNLEILISVVFFMCLLFLDTECNIFFKSLTPFLKIAYKKTETKVYKNKK